MCVDILLVFSGEIEERRGSTLRHTIGPLETVSVWYNTIYLSAHFTEEQCQDMTTDPWRLLYAMRLNVPAESFDKNYKPKMPGLD